MKSVAVYVFAVITPATAYAFEGKLIRVEPVASKANAISCDDLRNFTRVSPAYRAVVKRGWKNIALRRYSAFKSMMVQQEEDIKRLEAQYAVYSARDTQTIYRREEERVRLRQKHRDQNRREDDRYETDQQALVDSLPPQERQGALLAMVPIVTSPGQCRN